MNRVDLIKSRLTAIKNELPKEVKLVVVTKKSPIEEIIIAYESHVRDFGENRVDDLIEKAKYFRESSMLNARWHFIGKLQTNKINRLLKVSGLSFIHSIDSLKLLQALYQRQDHFTGKELGFFLQINTSDEQEKSGFLDYDELARAANLIIKNEKSPLKLKGLMTMSKLRTEHFEKDARACYKKLGQIKKQLLKDFPLFELSLSMGMSSDYRIAVEEGADFIRVGSTIFS